MEEFIIPVSAEDLQKRTSLNQYVVDYIVPTKYLRDKVTSCRQLLRSQGPTYIRQNFPNLFSVIFKFDQVDTAIKEEAWEITLLSCKHLIKRIAELLEEVRINRDVKSEIRMCLKMISYLLCQFIDLFENILNQKQTKFGPSKGKSKKKRAEFDGLNLIMDWTEQCDLAVQMLNQIFKLNIHQLWDPPVVEEDYINMISAACNKLLENPNLSKVASLRDGISNVLANLCKRHGHSLECSMKLTQLLRCFPHMVQCLQAMLKIFLSDTSLNKFVNDLLTELCNTDSRELERDSQATHSIAAFLSEFATVQPQLMQNLLPLLRHRLDEEPYTMRNCVLSIIGDIVLKIYSNKENLEQLQRLQKDKLLDVLEEHIHDINGFVRAKVLSVWLNIVAAGALPVRRQSRLLKLLVGHQGAILDTSSQARKNAIKIITTMIAHNPAGQVKFEDMKRLEEVEQEKLKTLEDKQDPIIVQHEREWNKILLPLQKALIEIVATDDDQAELQDDYTPEKVADDIHNLLHKGEYKKAIKLFNSGQEAFVGNVIFNNVHPTNEQHDDMDEHQVAEQMQKKVQLWLFKLQCIYLGTFRDHLPESPEAEPESQSQHQPLTQDDVAELVRQRGVVEYLSETVTLVGQIQAALPDVMQMLGSKTASDALEAIEFFVTGYLAGAENMEQGVRKMLALVWSKESATKDAVINAYRRLYLQPDDDTERGRALTIFKNLSKLVLNCTLGELLSLEKLVSEFMECNDLTNNIIQLFWEKFTAKLPGTTLDDRRAAILLIGMAASSTPKIVKSNVDILVKEGLKCSDGEIVDTQLVIYTCDVLQKIATKPKSDKLKPPLRFSRDHPMFTQAFKILILTFDNVNEKYWIPMMERTVSMVYNLSENPDVTCEELIRYLATRLTVNNINNEDKENIENAHPTTPSQSSTALNLNVSLPLLSRFIAICGHIAMKQLIYLDVSIIAEMKRRNTISEENEAIKKKKKKRASVAKDGDTSQTINEDDGGLTGATADDVEAEIMRKLCDTRLVTVEETLLGQLAPLIIHICSHSNKYNDTDLQASASLALAKFMLVSSEFCETNLRLLFTLAERSKSEVIRANLIVALGDLTKRFPNIIEPWTPSLYCRLRDESAKVRVNALNTLSHLILNDMIKVKGNISEITTCIVDGNERIVHLAKLFFSELSQKGNALYNVMPDIVSRLSDMDHGINEKDFRHIMDYLFPFIQKERLCETLVEKLCLRFRATENERQWRDLAYCLSVMNFNDKMVQKLHENILCYMDKLHVPEVYACFSQIIANAKKNTKNNSLALLEEFEAKVNEFHEKGVEDEEAMQKAAKAAEALRQKRKSSRKFRGTRNSQMRQSQVTHSQYDEENVREQSRDADAQPSQQVNQSEDELSSGSQAVSRKKSNRQKSPPPKSTRSKRTVKRIFDSDEDEND